MKKSILKTCFVLAITFGAVFCLIASADRVARDNTRFRETSSGNTVIDHTPRDPQHSVTTIDKNTGRATTTSN